MNTEELIIEKILQMVEIPGTVTEKEVCDVCEEHNLPFSKIINVIEALISKGVSITDETNVENQIIEKSDDYINAEEYFIRNNILFDDIDSLFEYISDNNIKCESCLGFFSYLIKKHYVHKLKAEYGGVYEYFKERLHYSKDHFNKMVKMGEKFIRIKQNVDFKNYHELTSFESYAYCVNSLKLPLKYTQIMEMLFLPDDQIIYAVKNQKIIPSMTAKEIRNYVSSLKNNGISDKFETVPLNVPVLRLGDTGYTVKRVQQILFMENYNIEVSGIFDQMTQDAIKKYQFDNGLNLNGICDSLTWKHLIL